MKTLLTKGVLENFCTRRKISPVSGINCDNSRLGAIILRSVLFDRTAGSELIRLVSSLHSYFYPLFDFLSNDFHTSFIERSNPPFN